MSSTETFNAEHSTPGYDANIVEVARLDAEDREAFKAAQREIRDANWFSVLFNPVERISPVLFRRGQMIVWLLRALAFVSGLLAFVIFGASFLSVEIPAGRGEPRDIGNLVSFVVVFFGVVFITSISSIAQHMSRMGHARRFLPLALVSALPILVLTGLTVQEAAKGVKFVENMRLMQDAARNIEKLSGEAGAQRATGAERSPQESRDGGQQAGARRADGQQAGGRGERGGAPGGRGGGGLGFVWNNIFNLPRILLFWTLAQIGAAIFTWTYAARVNPSGEAYARNS